MFRSTKTASGNLGLYDNPGALDGNTYDKPWTMEDHRRNSTMTIYDDIDESKAGYAELHSVKPAEQATSGDDAPEPPPPRPNEYLELVNVL